MRYFILRVVREKAEKGELKVHIKDISKIFSLENVQDI